MEHIGARTSETRIRSERNWPMNLQSFKRLNLRNVAALPITPREGETCPWTCGHRLRDFGFSAISSQTIIGFKLAHHNAGLKCRDSSRSEESQGAASKAAPRPAEHNRRQGLKHALLAPTMPGREGDSAAR